MLCFLKFYYVTYCINLGLFGQEMNLSLFSINTQPLMFAPNTLQVFFPTWFHLVVMILAVYLCFQPQEVEAAEPNGSNSQDISSY